MQGAVTRFFATPWPVWMTGFGTVRRVSRGFGTKLMKGNKVSDHEEIVPRILDELSTIESRLATLEKRSHSTSLAAQSTREAFALKRRQTELLIELSRFKTKKSRGD